MIRFPTPAAGPQHGAPSVLAYDLEFARSVPTFQGREDWTRMLECGISVLVSWSNKETEPRIWLPEDEPNWREFAAHALDHDILVTWNGIDCDDPMITVEFPFWEQVVSASRRVDMNLIAGLYGLARHKGLSTHAMDMALSGGIPDDFPTLVGYKPTARQNVRNGWSMEKSYKATFNIREAKSIPGALAPILWQQGKRAPVIGYCVGDAYRLLNLWGHAWDGNPLKNLKGHEAHIPKTSLGGP